MQGISDLHSGPFWECPIRGTQLIELGFTRVRGPTEREVTFATIPEGSQEKALIFLAADSRPAAAPGIAIVEPGVPWQSFPELNEALILECRKVKEALVKVLPLFEFTPPSPSSQMIASTARLGPGVVVAPGAYVGENVEIGEGSRLAPGVVLETGARIGAGTILHANVVVGHHCRIGSHCVVHPNTTIGSDGFGYLFDPKSGPQKVQQLGIVVIGDHVEIGGNCCFDRATLGATVIEDGCKFDNLCHVAHNCRIGRNSMIAAGFFVAGSSTIGANFSCGGNVVVSDHIKVCDNVALGGRSTVTKDIETPGAYTGYPLEPLKDGLRTLANLRGLTELRRTVADLKNQLKSQSSKEI